MVAKSAALREFLTLDAASKRSSVYVNPDREKYFELPVFFESDDDLTTCFNVLAQGREGQKEYLDQCKFRRLTIVIKSSKIVYLVTKHDCHPHKRLSARNSIFDRFAC